MNIYLHGGKNKSLQNPKTMDKNDIKEKIHFTQNFLKSTELVKNLLAKTTIGSDDVVYEIGAGTGIITSILVQICKKVIAIELDEKLFNDLENKFKSTSNIELRHGDFLKDSLPNYEYKVFSNVPFMITSDVVKKLVNSVTPPSDMYLIVQREFADKILGNPKGSILSITTKPWFNIEIIHIFSANDFRPTPRVNIVLLRLQKIVNTLIDNKSKELFKDFTAYSFTHSGPTLQKSLKDIFTKEQFQRLASNLKFSSDAKPTEITEEQWLKLFSFFLSIDSRKQELVRNSNARLEREQDKLQKIHRTRNDRNWKRI